MKPVRGIRWIKNFLDVLLFFNFGNRNLVELILELDECPI